MDKVKKYVKKIFKILSLKELSILPAYLAYNLVLALIPMITILIIIFGTLNISFENVISFIDYLLPDYASSVVVDAISGDKFDWSIGLFSIVTFVIAANGMYAIINVSNNLYKIDSDSQLSDRVRAFVMLIIMTFLILFIIIFLILGDKIVGILGSFNVSENIIEYIVLLCKVFKWPVTLFLIFFSVKLIYAIAPSERIKSEETTTGALITTIGWIVFTVIFGYYIDFFGRYDIIYGGLASIIILLIWFYVISFILILGIVINTMKYNKHH